MRKIPGSNRYPHFNGDSLEAALAESNVEYHRIEGLTGRRPVSHTVPFKVNAWWQNRSFHNYADHALGEDFARALSQLRELSGGRRVALMCSEAVWWRCHRRIIADHLIIAHGREVMHIMGPGKAVDAQPSKGLRKTSKGEVTYPAQGE